MVSESHYFYVLFCRDECLYAGYTNHLKQRIDHHNQAKGAKFTKPASRRPVRLVYAERWATKRKAMQREYVFKQLNRRQKLAFLADQGVVDLWAGQVVMVNGEAGVTAFGEKGEDHVSTEKLS